MSWSDVTEWPALDCQCDGIRNRPLNLLLSILMLLKLTVPHLVKQLPAYHGTGRFTTPPSAKWIQSRSFHLVSTRLTLILYYHLRLCLPSSIVPSGSHQSPLCIFLLYTGYIPRPSCPPLLTIDITAHRVYCELYLLFFKYFVRSTKCVDTIESKNAKHYRP